jgi:CxxC motif-containing protein (DUF1111 family)
MKLQSVPTFAFSALSLATLALGCKHDDDSTAVEFTSVGDEPVVATHAAQAAIISGAMDAEAVIEHGELLFAAMFNTLDGAERPEATGTGAARPRREFPQNFNRVSAPDANSCAGCHNIPRAGGGGDNVANVFVLGQALPFVNFDQGAGDNFIDHTLEGVANERNTLGMFGAGFIELAAREMTVALQTTRQQAIAAATGLGDVTLPLVAKGVDFGSLTAHADGSVDTSGVEGVNTDLVVRPFHQKGVVVSLREFSNNAMNHHHGMQTSERFGAGIDHDMDGHADELTVGDVTAVTLYQATLPAPGRVMPNSAGALAAVAAGEDLFASFGCAVCHVPSLVLDSPVFSEPSPFNPAGNLQVADGPTYEIDLTQVGPGPHLPKQGDGSVVLNAFTDLKRHDMGPGLDNEQKVQAGVPTEFFITRKLWGMANEPPFMHHGRATTIDEAILMHGGEAQAARDAYANGSVDERAAVVEFLKTLQVLPADATSTRIIVPASGVIGDQPAVLTHIDQADVEAGDYTADTMFQLGKVLFNANFSTLDGAGRPATNGTGASRDPEVAPHNFNRVSGPDANSCAGCHNVPRSGGGGDNVANVFVLGQALPFVNFDGDGGDGFTDHTLESVANERNTLGMFGAGFIEMLAREMTTDLHALRTQALADAALAGADVTVALETKGVSFGSLTAHSTGTLDTTGVEGVNADLVVRPFHQKGVVVSLREFTNNAMNHHHGIQPVERFGLGVDHDQDAMADELSVGDVTATAIYQALLPVPGRRMPSDPAERASVDHGEGVFGSIGCAVCHVPTLQLANPLFSEPNPFNPAGNLQLADVSAPFVADLTAVGPGPHLQRELDGSVLVPAFTDLKRHDMGVELDNEAEIQGGVPTNQFLTKKLWGFANEPPYLHNGRALTIDEAIQKHGGEGAAARAAYNALSAEHRRSVVDFLKTLQVLPEDSPLEVEDE